MNATNNSKKDCLILSVIVSQESKKKHMRGVIETNCRDYTLAEGMGFVASYLHPNMVEAHIRDMSADKFRDMINQEESIPQDLKPVVKLKPVDGNGRTGVYAQLFLCDLGIGGAMQKVHAQSAKYRVIRK